MNLSSNDFNLTAEEFKIARIMVGECLDGMGGERPADLQHDEYTWVHPEDLQAYGYSRHQVAGFISSLDTKGFIMDNNLGGRGKPEWCVVTEGWQWMDKVWDETAEA